MSDELLSMFFDDEFVPHAYLDAVYAQSAASSGGNNLTNLKYIQQLQERSAILLTHMDYYTNELTNELESQISKLYNCNSIVSYSYDASAKGSIGPSNNLKPTTRLEYYIDSLSISIHSLNDTIAAIGTKLKENKDQDSEGPFKGINKLLLLTKAKQNLLEVQNALETIKSVVSIAYDESKSNTKKSRVAPTGSKSNDELTIQITPSELQESLNVLSETIVEQLKNRLKTEDEFQVDKELLQKVDDFCDLLPVFKSLGEFNTVYSVFAKTIKSKKDEYLETKSLDDELSAKILK